MGKLNNSRLSDHLGDDLETGFAALKESLPRPSEAMQVAIMRDAVRCQEQKQTIQSARKERRSWPDLIGLAIRNWVPTGILAASAIFGVGAGYSMAEDAELAVTQIFSADQTYGEFDAYSSMEILLQDN